eukprot:Colp12_sorted_trinity150504_noHs@18102
MVGLVGATGWRIEPAGTGPPQKSELIVPEAESDYEFYSKNFFQKDHIDLLSDASGPVCVSLAFSQNQCLGMLRREQGYKRVSVTIDQIPQPWWRKLFGLGRTEKAMLQALFPDLDVSTLKRNKKAGLPQELVEIDKKQVIVNYKFGVLYSTKDQTLEEDMFNNDVASPTFQEFLNFLGDRIQLKGWQGYRGGLDVKDDTTGKESVYTKWGGHEVMYHVSTMLPRNEKDKQQLERKRHLGNDIVMIVFNESTKPYKADTVASKQNQVIFVVSPVGKTHYRIEVTARNGVPDFQPPLPKDNLIDRSPASRDFLLSKLINAERASYLGPDFVTKLNRTRLVLLQNLIQTYLPS